MNILVIPGFSGYKIDKDGNIYGKKGNKLKPFKTSTNKYFYVTLFSDKKKKKNFSVHRLVALTFINNTFHKEHVNHIDGDKLNNKVSNLEWVTREENMQHACRNKMHNTTKLSVENVKKIRTLKNKGTSVSKLASMFNVHKTTVQKLLGGRTWSHVV